MEHIWWCLAIKLLRIPRCFRVFQQWSGNPFDVCNKSELGPRNFSTLAHTVHFHPVRRGIEFRRKLHLLQVQSRCRVSNAKTLKTRNSRLPWIIRPAHAAAFPFNEQVYRVNRYTVKSGHCVARAGDIFSFQTDGTGSFIATKYRLHRLVSIQWRPCERRLVDSLNGELPHRASSHRFGH